jgi:hypothetical protein
MVRATFKAPFAGCPEGVQGHGFHGQIREKPRRARTFPSTVNGDIRTGRADQEG